ncbi:MAG: hypothetical protein ACK50C_06390 [Gemmatimonadaceae bacterium]
MPAVTHAEAFDVFRALRLRTPQHGAKLVWAFVAPLLDYDEPRRLSGFAIARDLDTKLPTVRRALRTLHGWGLVECTTDPGPQSAGWYRLGPAMRRVRDGYRAP